MSRNPLKPTGGGYTTKSRGPMTDAVRTGNIDTIKETLGGLKGTPASGNWCRTEDIHAAWETRQNKKGGGGFFGGVMRGEYKIPNLSADNPDKLNGSPGHNKGTLPNASMAVDNLSSAKQGVRGSLSMLAG